MTSPGKTPVPVGYLLKEIAVVLATCYLFLYANTWNALVSYDHIRLGVVLIAVLSLGWLVWSVRSGSARAPVAPLTWPLGLFLGVYLLTAFTSVDPRRSQDEVWVAGAYVFGFAFTAELVARGWPRELLVKGMLVSGAIVVGAAWAVALSWYSAWLAVAPGVWLPGIAYRLPLANGLATFLNVLLMLALARMLATRAWLPRLLLAGWALAALGLLFLTSSRGGWLGLLGGLAMLAVLRTRDAGGASYLLHLWRVARQRWTLALVILAAGIAAMAAMGLAAARQVINPEKVQGFGARSEYWQIAWEAFVRSPLVGQGPLTYGSAYLQASSVPPNGFFVHAHSVVFNLLAETGLAGVFAFGLLALSAFWALWQQVQRLQGEDRGVAVGALMAATAFAVHGIFDSVNVEPFNSTAIAVLMGAALSQQVPPPPVGGRAATLPQWAARFHWWPIALGLLLAATGLYNVWRLAPLHAGVDAANRGDWAEAARRLAEAANRDGGLAVAHQQLGLATALRQEQGLETVSPAIDAFERAAELDMDWWLNRANLGALYAARGEDSLALREMQAAAALAPMAPLAHLNLGWVAEKAGEEGIATQAYVEALRLRPDWGEAYFWRATPFRERVVAAWRAATPPTPGPTLTELEAVLERRASYAVSYALVAEAYAAAGRVAEAEALLRKADLANFDSGEDIVEVLWARAEVAAAKRNWTSASRLGLQAVTDYQAQSAFGPGALGLAAYAPNVFRKESMAADLVPQLVPAPFTDRWARRMLRVGYWHEMMGDRAGAAEIYRDLLNLVPDNTEAQTRLR